MSSSWNAIATYTIPQGRNNPIVFPKLLSASYVAVRVTPYKKNKWRKSGDLNQQFQGQILSPDFFVGWNDQTSYKMDTGLGDYSIIFTPVPYHKGFVIQLWELTSFVLRINCGGNQYVDSRGNLWLADTYFTGGQIFVYPALNLPIPIPPIELSADFLIFQDERSGNFSYQIPVPNGFYKVSLYFNESGFGEVGKRVFSVFANNQSIQQLDIFSQINRDRVLIKTLENVQVSTGFISITFQGFVDNPQINAIEIFKES